MTLKITQTRQKCTPITLVSGYTVYKVHADIRGGSSGRGHQTTVGLSMTTICRFFFGGYFFRKFTA